MYLQIDRLTLANSEHKLALNESNGILLDLQQVVSNQGNEKYDLEQKLEILQAEHEKLSSKYHDLTCRHDQLQASRKEQLTTLTDRIDYASLHESHQSKHQLNLKNDGKHSYNRYRIYIQNNISWLLKN